MKILNPTPLFAAAFLSAGSLLCAQDEAPRIIDEDRVVPDWQIGLENLDEKTRTKYSEHLREASRLFNQKRIFEALNEVANAREIFDKDPNALNLLGACHVEFRNFERAREAFEEALELQADYLKEVEKLRGDSRIRQMRPVVNILFNLGEMAFVTKKWQQAHDRFEKIIPELDPNNVAMSRLIEFKYMLCKLKLGEVEKARELSQKYDYLDDNPYYYYANSAMAYFDGDDEKAEEWRASARRVFRRVDILAPWEDTMIEFGYVKSFYGGPGTQGSE